MRRKKVLVIGEVSEGGIRYFAQMQASLFHLTGMAKKNSDGSVTLEVQGNNDNINKFIEKIREGNGFYKVSDIQQEEMQVIEEEKIFSIK